MHINKPMGLFPSIYGSTETPCYNERPSNFPDRYERLYPQSFPNSRSCSVHSNGESEKKLGSSSAVTL
jgi:hypothetical protein